MLKKCNSVRKKLVIFFCTFSSDLSSDKLAMKSLIIVLLIHVEVHLGSGRKLRTVQLIVQVGIILLFFLIDTLLLLLSLIEVLLIFLVLIK